MEVAVADAVKKPKKKNKKKPPKLSDVTSLLQPKFHEPTPKPTPKFDEKWQKVTEVKCTCANWVKVIQGQLWVICFEMGIRIFDANLELVGHVTCAGLKSVYDVTRLDGISQTFVVASSSGLKVATLKGKHTCKIAIS